jgi:hypothetical protein
MFKSYILYFSVLIVFIICIGSLIYTHNVDSTNDTNINNTVLKKGRIVSIVLDLPPWGIFNVKNISKFLLSGEWNMSFINERALNFMANFSMVSIKGENLHNHQFLNFEIKNDTFRSIQIPLDRNVTVSGTIDITTNGDIKWNKIRTNISLYNDNTIIIDFDHNQFIGQPVYGIVE